MTGEATHELMPSQKMRPRMGRLSKGVRAEGWQLADLMEGKILILKREGRLLQAFVGEKRRKKRKKGKEGKEEG